jgi:hypothetical protein
LVPAVTVRAAVSPADATVTVISGTGISCGEAGGSSPADPAIVAGGRGRFAGSFALNRPVESGAEFVDTANPLTYGH